MRIDVHAHYWTDDYLDLLVDLGQAGADAARGTDFPYENGDTFVRAVDYINDPPDRPGRRPGHPRPERQRPARHRTGTPWNRQLLGEDEVISAVIPPVLSGDHKVLV